MCRGPGWRAYVCTDTSARLADILGTVADRFSLVLTFRECKQVVGAGPQQVRFIWANVGALHICLWTYTMTEAWVWGRETEELVDRSASPWDKASRRPSRADKRLAWRRELLGEEIREVHARGLRGGNSGHGRKVAQPGRMTYPFSRKVQADSHRS